MKTLGSVASRNGKKTSTDKAYFAKQYVKTDNDT